MKQKKKENQIPNVLIIILHCQVFSLISGCGSEKCVRDTIAVNLEAFCGGLQHMHALIILRLMFSHSYSPPIIIRKRWIFYPFKLISYKSWFLRSFLMKNIILSRPWWFHFGVKKWKIAVFEWREEKKKKKRKRTK